MSFGRMWKRAVPHERSEVEWCVVLLRDAGVSVVAIGASLAARGAGHATLDLVAVPFACLNAAPITFLEHLPSSIDGMCPQSTKR